MAEKIQTIPMVRDEPVHPGGPVAADVHQNEVGHWQAHGWQVAPLKPDADDAPAPEGESKPKRSKP